MTSNRVALITGASRGIGKAITLALAENGLDVVINFASQHEAAAQVQKEASQFGVRAELLQADISQTADHVRPMESLNERFGRLDVLVNNAGVAPKVREDMLIASEESFDRLMNTNLRGPYFLTQRLSRWMVELRKNAAGLFPGDCEHLLRVRVRLFSQSRRLLFDESWNCDDDAIVCAPAGRIWNSCL